MKSPFRWGFDQNELVSRPKAFDLTYPWPRDLHSGKEKAKIREKMIFKYFFHLTEKLRSRKDTYQYLIGQMISLSQSRNDHRCQHCRGNVVHLVFDDTSKDIRDTIDVVANSWNQFGKIHQILPFQCAKRLFGTRYANRVTIRSLVTLNSDSSNWKQCCSEFCSRNRNIFLSKLSM